MSSSQDGRFFTIFFFLIKRRKKCGINKCEFDAKRILKCGRNKCELLEKFEMYGRNQCELLKVLLKYGINLFHYFVYQMLYENFIFVD